MADFEYAKPVDAVTQVRSEIGAAFGYPHDGTAASVDDTLFNGTAPNGTIVVANDGLAIKANGGWETIDYEA